MTTEMPVAVSRLSERVQAVPPSGIRKFFDVIATMPDVISLGVGEPDFATPPQVVEEGVRSLRSGRTHYTSNYGTIELRRALASHLERLYGSDYNPDNEICITVGASEAVAAAMSAITNPGDEVLLHEPSYVAYLPAIMFNGGTPVLVSTTAATRFRARTGAARGSHHAAHQGPVHGLSVQPNRRRSRRDDAARRGRYRGAPRPDRRQRRDLRPPRLRRPPPRAHRHAARHARAHDHDRWLLQGICHDRLARRLRLRAARPARRHRQGPPVRDHVGADTLPRTRPWLRSRAPSRTSSAWSREYDRRRQMFVNGLNEIGLTAAEPKGAFYAFPSIRSTGLTSEEFSERLLYEHKVAVVPGNAFGPSGEGHVRATLATSYEQLEEALVRMKAFVTRLH